MPNSDSVASWSNPKIDWAASSGVPEENETPGSNSPTATRPFSWMKSATVHRISTGPTAPLASSEN